MYMENKVLSHKPIFISPEGAFYHHLKHFENFGSPHLACLVKILVGNFFWNGILSWCNFPIPKTTAYLQWIRIQWCKHDRKTRRIQTPKRERHCNSRWKILKRYWKLKFFSFLVESRFWLLPFSIRILIEKELKNTISSFWLKIAFACCFFFFFKS